MLKIDHDENYNNMHQFKEDKSMLIVVYSHHEQFSDCISKSFIKLLYNFRDRHPLLKTVNKSLRIIHCISLNFIRTDYKVLHKSQKPKPSLLSKTFIQQTNQNLRTNEVNETECRPSILKNCCKTIQLMTKSTTITALNQNYILHL